jgi:hypothetical protein
VIDIRSNPVTVQFWAVTFSVSVCGPGLSPAIKAEPAAKANVFVEESTVIAKVESLGSPPVISTDARMPPVCGAVAVAVGARDGKRAGSRRRAV